MFPWRDVFQQYLSTATIFRWRKKLKISWRRHCDFKKDKAYLTSILYYLTNCNAMWKSEKKNYIIIIIFPLYIFIKITRATRPTCKKHSDCSIPRLCRSGYCQKIQTIPELHALTNSYQVFRISYLSFPLYFYFMNKTWTT